MSETFRNIVNFPHEAFGRATKKIMRKQPEEWYGKMAKGVGVTATGLFQFLFWITKYIALDNHVLRAGEKKLRDMQIGKDKNGQNNKLHTFMKKYPDLSSHIIYYMLILSVIGGVKAGSEISDVTENIKNEREIVKAKHGTYEEFLERIKPITPLLIADLIAKEGVCVNERGLHVVYDDATGKPLKPGQKAKGKPTIGFGCTRLKDGSPVTSYTAPITDDEAYELARHHIETGETYFLLYCYDKGVSGLDIDKTSHALGLGSIFYNSGSNLIENPNDRNHKERFTELRKMYKEYGYVIPDSLIVQEFAKYPVRDMCSFGEAWLSGKSERIMGDKLGGFVKQGRGLYWRRWLEAGLINGEITAKMLLQCPVHGMYEFFDYMGKKKKAFFVGDAGNKHVNYVTYDVFREWLKNPVNGKGESLSHWKKVVDYLPDDIANVCMNEKCEFGERTFKWSFIANLNKQDDTDVQKHSGGYIKLYDSAKCAYEAGDYAKAEKIYRDMLAQYPDNSLLRNDLAATYNKLGKYEDAIEQSREVIKHSGDKLQYSAAQYNIGFAYEQKGNLRKALASYKLALANGNKHVQKDITRVSEKIKQGNKRKIAFNKGIKQIKQKNAKHDLLLYGKEYKGNMT